MHSQRHRPRDPRRPAECGREFVRERVACGSGLCRVVQLQRPRQRRTTRWIAPGLQGRAVRHDVVVRKGLRDRLRPRSVRKSAGAAPVRRLPRRRVPASESDRTAKRALRHHVGGRDARCGDRVCDYAGGRRTRRARLRQRQRRSAAGGRAIGVPRRALRHHAKRRNAQPRHRLRADAVGPRTDSPRFRGRSARRRPSDRRPHRGQRQLLRYDARRG